MWLDLNNSLFKSALCSFGSRERVEMGHHNGVQNV
jgi:hypothetical protein